MKTLKLSPFLLFALFLSLSSSVKAQPLGTVEIIIDSNDSILYMSCPAPQTVDLFIYGNLEGYTPQDVITLEIDFGDGSDTTFTTPVLSGGQGIYFIDWFTHTYQSTGQFTVQYIAIAPDGASDTVVKPNTIVIGNSCGNISGTVYIDENSNCQYDQGETPAVSIPVTVLQGGNAMMSSYTDSSGNYSFNVLTGVQYEISVGGSVYGYTTACPSSGTIAVNSAPSAGNDFGIECGTSFDLEGNVTGWGFRPGLISNICFGPHNWHCLPTSGQAMLVLDDDPQLSFVGANPVPDMVNGDTLIWNFNDIVHGDHYGNCIWIYVLTDPSAEIGDEVCLDMMITPISGDQDPSNNTGTFCFPVKNSWDPNNKTVEPAGEGANGAILNNQEMTYRVNFQNTGTAPAIDIFILDTLDENLDVSTFEVLSSSHSMTTNILDDNILKFDFPDIWLADSVSNEPESHGFVSYKITQKTDLPHGTEIRNTAHIYFDSNPAVVTNTVLSTIDLSLSVEENGATVPVNVSIWPNPAQDIINIKFNRYLSGAGIQLLDMTGQVVKSVSANGLQIQIETNDLAAGAYTLVLDAENSEWVRKKIILVK